MELSVEASECPRVDDVGYGTWVETALTGRPTETVAEIGAGLDREGRQFPKQTAAAVAEGSPLDGCWLLAPGKDHFFTQTTLSLNVHLTFLLKLLFYGY